jgi:hypothetical protein
VKSKRNSRIKRSAGVQRKAVPSKLRAKTNLAKNPASLEVQAIDQRIAQLESDLEILRRAKILIAPGGNGPARPAPPSPLTATPSAKPAARKKTSYTIADASKMILRQHPQLHIRELLKRLADTYAISTTEKNLNKTLNKWAKKNLFKRVAPNTFALVESKPK